MWWTCRRRFRQPSCQEPCVAERSGYSVSIQVEDGTNFLASSGIGLMPPVWTLAQRRYAVVHKRTLVASGFKAKVVRVAYADVRMDSSRPT